MRYLLVVDVQKEFVKGRKGMSIYKKCLDYIATEADNYDAVLAAVYVNKNNPNMKRLLNWEECKKVDSLEFIPDAAYYHSGYSIKEYPHVHATDTIDIIGFDTDACVLSACFHVFDLGCNMNIITDLIFSSGGSRMHEAGLAVMKRQFGSAVK